MEVGGDKSSFSKWSEDDPKKRVIKSGNQSFNVSIKGKGSFNLSENEKALKKIFSEIDAPTLEKVKKISFNSKGITLHLKDGGKKNLESDQTLSLNKITLEAKKIESVAERKVKIASSYGTKGWFRKTTDEKVFAQLQNPHRILNTSYEGNTMLQNALCMKPVLESLLEDSTITKEEKTMIKEGLDVLNDRIGLNHKVQGIFSSSSRMYNHILSELNEGKSVYLPSGWTEVDGGHAAMVKFWKDGDKLCYYVINKGDGIENHPILEYTVNGKEKRDLRSIQYQMDWKDFSGSQGKNLCNALYQIKQRPKKIETLDRGAKDLYGACFFYSKSTEVNKANLDYASTAQLSGNCTQASLNASLLDYFLSNGKSRENANRFMFLVRQKSLQHACQDWMKDIERYPERRLMLRDAAQQHLIRIDKLRKNEGQNCEEGKILANKILEDLDKIEKQLLLSKSLPTIKLDLERSGKSIKKIESRGVKELKEVDKDLFSSIVKLHGRPKTAEDAVKQLEYVVRLAQVELERGGDPARLLIELTKILQSLPLSHESEFWEKLSPNEASLFLENLEKLTFQILECAKKELDLKGKTGFLDKERINEAMLIAYDVGIKVASLTDEMQNAKLNDYKIALPKNLENSAQKELSHGKKLEQISKNFSDRNKKATIKDDKERNYYTDLYNKYLFSDEFEVGKDSAHRDFVKSLYGNRQYDRLKYISSSTEKERKKEEKIFPKVEKELIEQKSGYKSLLLMARRARGINRSNLNSLTESQVEPCNCKIQTSEDDDTLNPGRMSLFPETEKKLVSKELPIEQRYLLHPKKSGQIDGYFENKLLQVVGRKKLGDIVSGLDNRFLGQLALIERGEGVASLQMLSWAKENPALLSHPYVQKKMTKILFTGNHLNENLKNEEHTASLIHQFLNVAIKEYQQSESLETYLWILELADLLNLRLQDNKKPTIPTKNYFLELMEKESLSLDQKRLVAIRYIVRYNELELSEKDYPAFLKAIFLFQAASVNPGKKIERRAQEAFLHYKKQVWNFFVNSEDKGKIANEILKLFATNEETQWELKDKRLTNGTHALTFNGQVLENGQKKVFLPLHLQHSSLCQKYYGKQGTKTVVQDSGYYLDTSLQERILPTKDNLDVEAIEKEITLSDTASWFRYQTDKELEVLLKQHPFWPVSLFKEPNKVYLEVDKDSPKMVILNEKGEIRCRVEKNEGVFRVYEGTESSTELVSLSAVKEKNNPWKNWLEQIELPEEVSLGLNEKGDVSQINFPRLNLHFNKNEDGKLECTELPGFFLKKSQATGFGQYKGAIVLENNKGETKTIIPCHSLKAQEKKKKGNEEKEEKTSFAMKVSVDLNVGEIGKSLPGYFVFNGSGKETLQSETRQGALYLSLLYRAEKNYSKAVEQLKKSDSPFGNTEGDLEIEEWLYNQPDESPEGVAFDLQFFYQMKRHEEKWVESNVVQEKSTNKRNAAISELSNAYKGMVSGKFEDVYQIPIDLRLTNDQKMFLGVFENENDMKISPYSSSQQIEGFSYLFQSNNSEPNSYQLLKDLSANYKDGAFDRLPGGYIEIQQKKEIESIKDEQQKTEAIRQFHLERIASVGFSFKSSNKIPPFDLDNFIPGEINGAFLQKHFNRFINALSNDQTREKAKRYLINLSRYFKENSLAKPLLEMLLVAGNVPAEDLKGVKKDKDVDSFKALLTKILDGSYDKYLKLDLKEWGWLHGKEEHKVDVKLQKKLLALQKKPIEFTSNDLSKDWIKEGKVAPLKALQGFALTDKSSEIVNLQKELAEDKLKKNRKTALNKANIVTAKNLIGRGGKQLKKLTMEDLTAAYLKQDASSLMQANPNLTANEVKEIFKLLMEVDLCEYQLIQLGEIKDKLASNATNKEKEEFVQKIANAQIDLETWMKYPQLSLFVANTGMWPRSDQIEVIDWALKKLESGDNLEINAIQARMLNRGAGFGKTKVFTAIVAQIAANRGFLTTIFNVSNLYDFGKKDLSESLRKAFMQNVEFIEWNLGDKAKITLENLELLLGQLKKWKEEGRVILLKPETWHLINLARKRGKLEENESLENVAEDVLKFLEKGFALLDEAHLILNPLTEVIQAIGEPSTIPKEHMKQLIQNYEVLKGIKDLGLVTHQHVFANEELIRDVQGKLIKDIIKREEFKACTSWLKNWLEKPMTTKQEDFPKELGELAKNNSQLFDLIEMQRRAVQSLIPHALKQRGKIDYGKFPEPKDGKGFALDHAAPRHDTKETTSSFADEYITAALSCQMLMQEGIQMEPFMRFFDKLIQKHQDQKRFEKGVTPIEVQLQKILNKKEFSLTGLPVGELTLKKKEIYELCKNNAEFQKYYLENEIQPQIQRYKKSIASTPAELLSRFGVAICLTATPGSLETYPIEIQQKEEDNQLDLKSMENDISQMRDSRNNQIVIIDPLSQEKGELTPKSPEKIFSEVHKKLNSNFMDDVQFIIDGGGVFRNVESNESVIDEFQKNQKEKGGKERNAVAVKSFDGERSAFFKEYDVGEKITPLPGSQLAEEMKKAKNDPKKLEKALHFISLQEATGTDWVLPDSCTGLFFIGEKMTLSSAIQAIKRDRKLANPNHKFAWVIPKAVAESICEGGNPTQEQIIQWLKNNEVEAEKSKKQMRFTQGLNQILEGHQPKKKGAEYNPMIATETELSPSELYQQKKELKKYDNPLFGVIMEKIGKMYPKEDFANVSELENLKVWFSNEEIQKFKLLMNKTPKLNSNELQEGSLNKERQVEQEKEKENQVEKQEEREVLIEDPEFDITMESSEDYFHYTALKSNKSQFNDIANYCDWPSKIKGPTLYGSGDDFFKIGKNKERENIKAIRPISGMLVMLNNQSGKYEYFVLSEMGMNKFSKEFQENDREGTKFAIFSPSGDLLMEESENRWTENQRKELLSDPSLEEAITLMAMSQGKVRGSPECLKRVFGELKEEEFDQLEKQVKANLIGPGASFEETAFLRLKALVKEPMQKEEVLKKTEEVLKKEVEEPEKRITESKDLQANKFTKVEKELKKTEPLFVKRPSVIGIFFSNLRIKAKRSWTYFSSLIKTVSKSLFPW